ncbi:MAG TPA: hypothetical protein VD902_02555 [Symbiobacteriaceae bacterium]|nr:hypothetical protein [Symbiobacteriaceae bacterium]
MDFKLKRFRRTAIAAAMAVLMSVGAPGLVLADGVTISPDVNNFTLAAGETWDELITVTVPPNVGASKADVYLLADTTGSMGSPIASVKAGASDIVDGLMAELPGVDLAFGAGDFKDFPYDAYAFNHAQSITNNSMAVQGAIAGWSAGGGADGPEGQFFAYDRIADDAAPLGGTIGWRPGAEKILVVFGDAPGHDAVCSAISGLPYDITEASVTAKLAGSGITFIGISTLTGFPAGMDSDPAPFSFDYNAACGAPGGAAGQATRIAAATGGSHVSGVNSTEIVQLIKDLVTNAVNTINSLSLVPTGDTAQFVSSITPASYGPLNSDVEHVLEFHVNWLGTVACADEDQVFTGTLDVMADGAVVAQKQVTITVPECPPEPVLDGRMTGGGSTFTEAGDRVTHGFTLYCDTAQGPNRLQINWGKNRFHLETLDSALCYDDENLGPEMPDAPFDTYVGSGTGRLNNEPGATVTFTFTDAGEPGTADMATMEVRDAANNVVLSVSGYLNNGNHQAHTD